METMIFLFSQLKLTGLEPPSLLQQYIYIASDTVSLQAVKFLCAEMISYPLSAIGQAAAIVAGRLINSMLIS